MTQEVKVPNQGCLWLIVFGAAGIGLAAAALFWSVIALAAAWAGSDG